MATVRATAERTIPAGASEVFAVLADPERRREILPEAYHDVTVVSSDSGDPMVTYTLHAGGRQRDYRVAIVPAELDRLVRDEDALSTLRTEWALAADGDSTTVTATTTWQGAGGVGGFFERTFAPKGVARLHQQTLEKLEQLVRS
jgi:hypothetical protein